ncbi:M14 family metallopeptidase [Variovorax saccharolyticus]|uniref:M14 family metallopeptidase n=1 Tax=Variovorax saccharolyticus TaxID=3053516 RepID=UPI00257526C5|nr:MULTISPECIES: M14 family metallopeptidase [unclassified Variovorax]MDM0017380.1 M14 family metallopeptidase [Variovorax sp. J22R187]MDM0026898.1 M14 family metallopeptidase [Variovorax sp. J31P216]
MSAPTALAASVERCFSASYAQARERFLAAATACRAELRSFGLEVRGAEGEALATDVALIGAEGAKAVLILSSATHGVEGFCGSACQLALMVDADLLARAARSGVALLLIHAINPYGFSWISRTNEDNIDLNRNAQDFGGALPANPGYAELHALLLPAAWPPDEANRHAVADHIARHGALGYRDAVSKGQYTHPDGLFFGGGARTASLRTLEQVLRTQAAAFAEIGWIDVHTGLGPWGHGEKIFAGRRDAEEVARARRWWGADVAVPFAGTSTSADITGHLASTIYAACPDARRTLMALEFGTVPFEEMVDALRGEAWLRQHPEAPPALAGAIRQTIRDAFYCDQPAWQGMVLGQSRLAILQALLGLAGPAD